jgi:activator of HSP90 ATPase
MTSGFPTRREVASRLFKLGVVGLSARAGATTSEVGNNGLSHNCECIHQEVLIRVSRDRIYRALTDAKQFHEVTELSYHEASTDISPEVGGAFSIFGGLIGGRQIEMVPNELLVQAWREKTWTAGVYSIVRFQLQDAGSGTKIIFDHTGFPRGAGEHLASGWSSHYWEPLRKYLGTNNKS